MAEQLYDLAGVPPVYPVVIGRARPPKDISLANVSVSQTSFEDAPVMIQADVEAGGYAGRTVEVERPSEVPEAGRIREFREPIVVANFIVPAASIGPVMKLAESRRAAYKRTEYLSASRVILTYELPLAEMMYDFYDRLKSVTRGYGTMDYELSGFRAEDLVRVDVLVAGRLVDADRGAYAALRVMVNCNQFGEAAGTAAALALQGGTDVASVDTEKLRRMLADAGSIVI